MGSVNWRKRGNRYQVAWRLDDGTQGAKTVATKDEALDLVAEKRLEMSRSTWQGRRRGRLPFSRWADEWWAVWSTDPSRSPTTLAATEIRLRRHVRPFFGDRPIEAIQPMLIRQWQNQLPGKLGFESLMACRSILFRILQLAEDEGAITVNPLRRVPPPKRRADPEKVLGQAKRRAYTPEEAGRLLASCPLFWWDHVLVLFGTGLRFGEFAGLRRRRVHLERMPPVLQVVDVRYQAGRFGSGFKPRPKSDAGIREVPLAPLVVEAIRSQLPPGAGPDVLVFAGPAAATTWPLAPGPCCPGTASVACTRPPSSAPTSTTSSCAAPTTSAIPSRLGWRMPASPPESSTNSWATSAVPMASWTAAAGSAPATGTPRPTWPPGSLMRSRVG
jgi:integrase